MFSSKNYQLSCDKSSKSCQIKAIETEYNGYKFRSRLEARWAVFFDALEVKYEYEPEGYDIGEYGYYLPDFWLPELKIFVEVKPDSFIEFGPKDSKEIILYKHFVNEIKKPLLLLTGVPDYRTYFLFKPGQTDNTGGNPVCFLCWGKYLNSPWQSPNLLDYLDIRQDKNMVRFYFNVTYEKSFELFGPDLVRAIKRAKQARFEHGETPKVEPVRPVWAR